MLVSRSLFSERGFHGSRLLMPPGDRSLLACKQNVAPIATLVALSWFHFFALGNKSGGFCEAVNCERSEQEGMFLSAMQASEGFIAWFP